jgi:uncharacterized repeat protein (TIGR01451 family)
MDTVSLPSLPSGTTVTAIGDKAAGSAGYEWTGPPNLACGDSAIFTYRLVARDTAIAVPDTNKVHVSVTLPKNNFDSPPGTNTTIAADTALTLRIYESIDIGFTQRIDTSGGVTDTLACDSLFQPVKLLLTATNVGSSPLENVQITGKLQQGMKLDSAELYLILPSGTPELLSMDTTPPSTGIDDTIYIWNLSNQRVGPDSALQIIVYTTVAKTDTFIIVSYAFESGKADVDSTDNYGNYSKHAGADTLAVIFWPKIDIEVKKWRQGYPVAANMYVGEGGTVKYSIAVTNNSDLPLRGVEVRDTLFKTYLEPDTMESKIRLPKYQNAQLVWGYAAANPDPGDDSSFVWTIPHLDVGQSDTLEFLVKAVKETRAANGSDWDSVRNTAYAYFPLYSSHADSVYPSNTDTIKIQEGADLCLKVTIDRVSQRQNDTVRLKAVITNISTTSQDVTGAIKVRIDFNKDSLRLVDSSLTLTSVSYSNNEWTVRSGTQSHFYQGESDSITLTLVAKEKTGFTELVGYISPKYNSATSNDTSRVYPQITQNPVDLSIAKAVEKDTIYLDHGKATIRDTITLRAAANAIENIRLTDTLPAIGMIAGSIVVTTSRGTNITNGVDLTDLPFLRWTTSLASLGDTVIVVAYDVNQPGQYISGAYAHCDSIEATWSNNAARDTVVVRARTSLKATLTARVLHPELVGYSQKDVLEGDTIIYTLVARHNTDSDADADDVTLAFDSSIVVNDSTVFIAAWHGSDTLKTDPSKGIVFNGIDIPKNGGADSIVMLVRVKPNAFQKTDSIRCIGYLGCSNDVHHEDDTASIGFQAQRNDIDLSISVTPVDTFFYLSEAQGDPRTPSFTYRIAVRNTRSTPTPTPVSNVTVRYRAPKGFELVESNEIIPMTTNRGDGPFSDGTLEEFIWNIDTVSSADTVIIINNRHIPYDKVGSYESLFTVSAAALDADPANNAVRATAKACNDVDLSVDSIWLFNKSGGAAYRQGDTIGVGVRLTNKYGSKAGEHVAVWAVNPNGFTAIDSLPHALSGSLTAKTGVLYDTLWFAIDTFTTTSGGPLRFRVAASADDVSANPHTSPVRDSAWSAPFGVEKGADAAVWVEKVEHAPLYYANLSYTIAVTNSGPYRATGITLYHAVPDTTFRVDSVHIEMRSVNAAVDTTLLPPSYPPGFAGAGWRLETVGIANMAANGKDTALITLYVTLITSPDSATLPIAGYIACANDNNELNDTIVGFAHADSASLKITKNPYHLKLTKTADNALYGSITDTVTYTIVLANVGDSTAYNVMITDTIPESLRLLDFSGFQHPDTAHYGDGVIEDSAFITWKITEIASKGIDTLIIRCLPYEAGPIANKVQVVKFDTTLHPFDPDPKNRGDQASVDTAKVHSAQQIKVTTSVVSYPSSVTSNNTFTQGDTVLLTVKVEKTIPQEKALGIKITLDTASFGDNLSFYGYDTANVCQLEGSKFDLDSFAWTLNLDTCSNASGELKLYAVIGPNIPDRNTLLDSLTVRFNVKSSNEYYPMKTTASEASSRIYITYCDFDLAVEVKATLRAAYKNMPFDYNISVKNLRGALDAATDAVTLVDTLPRGVSFGVAHPPCSHQETLIDGREVLYWDNLTPYLGAGEYQLVVQNCTGGSAGDILISKVRVISYKHEATLRNNSSADTVVVLNPSGDVELTFEPASDTVAQGSMVDLRVTITNRSGVNLSDLKVGAATIPTNLRFISSDNGGKYSTDTFSWKNNDRGWYLQPDSSKTITLTVQAVGTGMAAWKATLLVKNSKMAVDTMNLYVKKNPYNVTLTKTASQNVFFKSDSLSPLQFSYTVSVKNTGDNALTGVEIRDTLPAGVTCVNGSYPPVMTDACDDGSGRQRTIVTLNVGTLEKGGEKTITVSCEIADSVASYLNRAYVTCSEPEAVTTDNTDTALVEVRNKINLKVQVALCDVNGVEYSSDHEFIQGDDFYVKVSVTNNGEINTNTETSVIVSKSDFALGVDTLYTYPFGEITAGAAAAAVVKIFKVLSKKAGHLFSISAVASTSNFYDPSIVIKDSASVSLNILPGADMEVTIAASAPDNSYTLRRAYTIHLKNIGQFRADGVELEHTLDTLIVSLDSIRVVSFDGSSQPLVGGGPIDTTLTNQEAIKYDNAARKLAYSISKVEKGGSASIALYVTTAKPKGDTALQIWPEAIVNVSGGDAFWGNNQWKETPIIVEPNPYNVSVTISPRSTETRNTITKPAEPVKYTITAANIGKRPADKVEVYFDTHALLKIIEKEDDKTMLLGVTPQLRSGEQLGPFEVTVAAENLSSKGKLLSFARIEVGDSVFRQNEADVANNGDTARLLLFSMLDELPVMEAFSPNGDGKNDKFVIPDLESNLVEKAELVIVSRYGSEVYYHANYKDAQKSESTAFTGAGLSEGSYFYRLTVTFDDGSTDKRGGVITIRRSRWK